MSFNKLNSGHSNGRKISGIDNIFFTEVVHVGKLNLTNNEIVKNLKEDDDQKVIKKRLERFNADEHAIKVVIPGSKYDGSKEGNEYTNFEKAMLPNCFPLIPKHINFVPKVGELVLTMVQGSSDVFDDRFYIGPIISSLTKLEKDLSTTALSNFSIGNTEPTEDISKDPKVKGVFQDPKNVIIQGRGNTDIIQREEEILLRSSKFKSKTPLTFNDENPGFIQIKSNFLILDNPTTSVAKKISVTNIVSDRINLLTYNGSPNLSENKGLTKVNGNFAEYIDNEKLDEILKGAHQLVFGDILIEYLKLIRSALLNHVHNGSGNPATDMPPVSISVADFKNKAEKLENAMLSKNIRIN
tara:strand:+ start:7560 stop:8624 length:1065 start_codon:yes stop_codon:yes gene_type:complete